MTSCSAFNDNEDAHNTTEHDAQEPDARDTFTQAALRIPGTSRQTHARCALPATFGHAPPTMWWACERSLAAAERLRAGPGIEGPHRAAGDDVGKNPAG
jgi:hypothetical protein